MTELTKKYSHLTYLASPINEPERQVVLTVFNASLFRLPHEREKWQLQAQLLKEFEHPHLVPILDIGVEEEQPFVVREYLPNGSLRSRLKQLSPDHLELREALTIVLQVGLALTYAHEHHVLHGNIKPENILFKANGQAVLTDFSLVSRKDDSIRDQSTEEYAFCYMAPEQLAGTCDARSDQYALGCLAYELITGRLPFGVQSLASMIGLPNPAPLSERVADLPPSLDAAVLKTLAKNPDERFFDFSLFLEVVQSVLSPPPAFPLGDATRSRKKRTPSHPMRSAQVEDTPFLATKEETNDWLLTTIFGGEETNASLVKVSASVHEWSDPGTGNMMVSLPGDVPLVRQTKNRKRIFLVLVLLLSVIVALITCNFLPFQMAQPSTSSRVVQKGIQVTLPQIPPIQVPNVSLVQTPIQLTNTPMVQPSVQVKTIPTVLLSPLTATVSPSSIMSYEAEASQNTLAGGAAVVNCPECSGGERVEQIGRGGTLLFNDVKKSNMGNYTLTIYYTNGSGNRLFYMSLNSGSSIALGVPATGTWHTVGTLSVTVSLNAGKNTILFFNSSARGPDIDRIVV